MYFKPAFKGASFLAWVASAAMVVLLAQPAFAQVGTLVLTQEEDENDVGTDHTVLATANDGENPVVSAVVTFTVLSGPNVGATGTCAENLDCSTNETGRVSFTYNGAGGPGMDMIQAFFVDEGDTTYSNILEKTWVLVGDNQAPVAACKDTTLSAGDQCEVAVSIDDGSFDPDQDPITMTQVPAGPYPVGETSVMLIVTDDSGAADTCTATVTVVDDVPPEITVELNHEYMWPPNHKLWEICATVSVEDNCSDSESGIAWTLDSVTSSEPDNQKHGGGDGNTDNDIQGADTGTDDGCVMLRAERRGNGDGRVYTLVFSAQDSSGNSASDTVEVHVAHDQGGKDDEDAEDDDDETEEGTRGGLGLTAEEYGQVQIEVFDVRGRRVQMFMLNMAAENSWTLGWNGKTSAGQRAPSGLYFYRITTPIRQMLRRVVITP